MASISFVKQFYNYWNIAVQSAESRLTFPRNMFATCFTLVSCLAYSPKSHVSFELRTQLWTAFFIFLSALARANSSLFHVKTELLLHASNGYWRSKFLQQLCTDVSSEVRCRWQGWPCESIILNSYTKNALLIRIREKMMKRKNPKIPK
jgi:hypothetical protein